MGVVIAAMHLSLDERVAIKLLLPELASEPELVTRFLQEGRAAIKIRGEHVARVLDVGTLEDGAPFLVMEYLDGTDFEQLLAIHGPRPAEDVAEWVLQACEALAEAHGRGLIHRDLKPANLFLVRAPDGGPCVKVLDFGISKIVTGEDLGLTDTRATLGSPRYMAPEQARRTRPVDAYTDVWALGTIMYELLTGATPFEAETLPELVGKLLLDPPEPVVKRRSDVPTAMSDVVMSCLEKDPDDRFGTVAELAAALAPFAPGGEGSAERVARILTNSRASKVPWATPSVPRAPTPERSTGPGLATTVSASPGPFESKPRGLEDATTTPSRGSRAKRPVAIAIGLIALAVGALGVAGVTRTHAGLAPTEARSLASDKPPTDVPTPQVSPATCSGLPPSVPSTPASPPAPASASASPTVVPPVSSSHARPPLRHARPAASAEPNGSELFDDRK
jgi:serine/threonine-protein kinase